MTSTRFPFLALALCGVLMAASCDEPPPRPNRAAGGARGSLLGPVFGELGLVSCTPMPYDSVTQVVGPLGGVLQVGPHSLSIPAGALSEDVSITAVAPSDTINFIRFQPEGLVFDKKATLTMSYANCGLLGGLLPAHIAYTGDDLGILELLKTTTQILSQTVQGTLRHFSGYAVAW